MEESRKKQANLRLLQRTCSICFNSSTSGTHQESAVGAGGVGGAEGSLIEDILATATHAVLYEFDTTEHNWKKCQVEGSLFLASGSSTPSSNPFYALIILNRSSTENFQLQVIPSLQVQHQEPYLILRLMTNSSEHTQSEAMTATTVWGIWFHNADERVAVHQVLQTVLQTLKENPTSTAAPQLPTVNSNLREQAATARTTQSSANVDTTSTAMAEFTLKTVLGIGIDSTSNCYNNDDNNTSSNNHTSTNINDNTTHADAGAAAILDEETAAGSPVALDKKSLQLALLSLIQDDRFLDLLHSQYLRVARTRAKKNQQQQSPGQGDANP